MWRNSRKRLEEQIRRDGFERVMEAMAYTWFNRFAAIRYMELHGYLDHGYRVLSHPEGQDQPEILEHAADVDLPGLDREKAVELKLDGSKDEELYRLLLTGPVQRPAPGNAPFSSSASGTRPSYSCPQTCCTPDSPHPPDWLRALTRAPGGRSRSSAGSTSFTSRRRRARSLARLWPPKTFRRQPSSSRPAGL